MLSRLRDAPRYPWLWLMLCTGLFTWWYIGHSRVGINSVISAHANLAIEPPFVFRMLVPCVMAQTMPAAWLDLAMTRFLLAACVALLAISLMPAYMARITGCLQGPDERWRSRLALLLVFIAHYALPRAYKFYYVYDLPAVLFGMLLFMLLTDGRAWVMCLGVLVAPIVALNRETAIVAALHAGAWWWVRLRWQHRFSPMSRSAWLSVGLACAGILMCRWLTLSWMDLPPSSSVSWMDGDELRILANARRIVTKHFHALALLWFGAGALIWLPRHWRLLPGAWQAMALASMLPGVLYAVVGNVVELRMFSELVPLFAAGLALTWLTPPQARVGQVPALQPGT